MLPKAGAAGWGTKLGAAVDHGRQARGAGAFDRCRDVARVLDDFAVAAEAARDRRVVGVGQRGAELEVQRQALAHADHAPGRVVVDDGDHRQLHAPRGVELLQREAEGAVAGEVEHRRGPGASAAAPARRAGRSRGGSCPGRGSACARRAPASGRCSRRWCGRRRRPPARRAAAPGRRPARARPGASWRACRRPWPPGARRRRRAPGAARGSQSSSVAGVDGGNAASRSSSASFASACIATLCSAGLPSAEGSMLMLMSA